MAAGFCAKTNSLSAATEFIACAVTGYLTCVCPGGTEVVTSCAAGKVLLKTTPANAYTCPADSSNSLGNCSKATYDGTTYSCTECKAADYKFNASNLGCTQCAGTEFGKSDFTGCVAKVTNCESTSNTTTNNVAGCTKCDTGYLVNAAKTACHKCSDLAGWA